MKKITVQFQKNEKVCVATRNTSSSRMSDAIGSERLSRCYKVMAHCPSHIIFCNEISVTSMVKTYFLFATQISDSETIMENY